MQTTQQLTQTIPPLGRYRIDPGGPSVTFRTRHLFGLAPVRGSFAIRAGTVNVSEPLAGSRIYAEIETRQLPHRQPAAGCPGPLGPVPGR